MSRRRWLILAYSVAVLAAIANTAFPHFDRRMRDLEQIVAAVEDQKDRTGQYPVSRGEVFNPGTGPRSWISGIDRAEWIPPIDPAASDEASRQYLYISDGQNFKVVAHGTEDAGYVAKARPEIMDPVRPSWAYGFWTEGGVQW